MGFNGDRFRYGWSEMKLRRREFRRNPTRAESILWEHLKAKKLNGYQFRRQHGIGRFVVDFCNTKTRTIIELDGSIHLREEVRENDRLRQMELEQLGYSFLRFSNVEVYKNIEGVLKTILKHLEVPSCQGGDSSR